MFEEQHSAIQLLPTLPTDRDLISSFLEEVIAERQHRSFKAAKEAEVGAAREDDIVGF